MTWRYEMRMEQVEGMARPIPKFIFSNGVDTEIDNFGTRQPMFLYKRPDLSFVMAGSRDLRGIPRDAWDVKDNDFRLGPVCLLHLDEKSLSRRLSAQDYPRITADFKAALSLFLQLPGAMPPGIKSVRFYNEFLAPYGD